MGWWSHVFNPFIFIHLYQGVEVYILLHQKVFPYLLIISFSGVLVDLPTSNFSFSRTGRILGWLSLIFILLFIHSFYILSTPFFSHSKISSPSLLYGYFVFIVNLLQLYFIYSEEIHRPTSIILTIQLNSVYEKLFETSDIMSDAFELCVGHFHFMLDIFLF